VCGNEGLAEGDPIADERLALCEGSAIQFIEIKALGITVLKAEVHCVPYTPQAFVLHDGDKSTQFSHIPIPPADMPNERVPTGEDRCGATY
jgi:hypothetical protein